MPKSSSGRSKNGSEVSSRSERRRTEDEQTTPSRSRDESTPTSSSSRRKSSKRDADAENEGFMPSSTSFSSSSRAPYAGVAAPSVASSYATAYTGNPDPPQLVRNESMNYTPKRERKDSNRESKSSSKSERSRGNDSDDESRNVGRQDSERSSRRESRKLSRKESSRSFDEHESALPQNQFPGQGPSQYTEPYRPPGLAASYYGDQGESVQYQPGVRPNQPSIIHTADQAHLMEARTDSKPPPEPSSMGQVGAAASFFAMNGSGDDTTQQSTPSKPGRKPSSKTSKSSKYNNQASSPRGSPGPSARISGSMAGSAFGAAAGAAGLGAAADYYSGNMSPSGQVQGGGSIQSGRPPRTTSPESYAQSSRPPQDPSMGSQSGSHHYGGAVATGLAGAAATSYLAGHSGSHHNESSQYGAGPSSGFVVGQNQSSFPAMQQQRRQKRRGPLGKLVNWFKDPQGVAEFEAYTEAIGVCKYCFDPHSSPADAPRRHHYHSHSAGRSARYGSSTRVDKTYRYSSSDDDRKRSSTAKKMAATGLAGYGAAKLGQAVFNQKHDFDDTYSVKSGRPTNRSRVSFKEEDERYSGRIERRESKRKSRRDDERYEKRSSRRRGSSSSSNSSTHSLSRGNVWALRPAQQVLLWELKLCIEEREVEAEVVRHPSGSTTRNAFPLDTHTSISAIQIRARLASLVLRRTRRKAKNRRDSSTLVTPPAPLLMPIWPLEKALSRANSARRAREKRTTRIMGQPQPFLGLQLLERLWQRNLIGGSLKVGIDAMLMSTQDETHDNRAPVRSS